MTFTEFNKNPDKLQVVRKRYLENKNTPPVKGVENKEVLEFLEKNLTDTDPDRRAVLSVDNKFSIENLPDLKNQNRNYSSLVNLKKVNDIQQLTQFFCAVNNKLEIGGRFITCVETYNLRKERIHKKYPEGINKIYYLFDYIGKRVVPKLPITRNIYHFLTANRNRVLSSVEVLGRLSYCGFKVVETRK